MKPNLFLEDKKHCVHCHNDSFFFVRRDSCKSCVNNGIREDGGYAYRDLRDDEERTEIEEDGECLLGTGHGEGCSILVCSRCQKLHEHVPFTYD